jgi:NAD(P)-dependent dehydrogenase (short-subunit alcohol dehydrogenase family)
VDLQLHGKRVVVTGGGNGVVPQIHRGQMGTAEEVARIVAFIAGPAAVLLTGANIVAEGA